jgi:hypothetical protein
MAATDQRSTVGLSRVDLASEKQKGVGRRRFRREPPFAVKD